MRLERIELIGFKSFADKTVFNFHPGITAIVGPNGCGKSNVVDAFKWVLGEQSAKSLRGESMEDVIFFGSATRKTRGLAEVTIVLSGVNSGTSKGNGGSGNGEISITRRLYRSGESEYLINKVPCRLRDIKDMLLDTGLEVKAYSILEQGRISAILESKPQDRRFLIEEVAGVMKYKARKAEAVQKLEASKSNLQRLQDIINEVKRQINSIDRHARRAERYRKLFEEIKDIETRMAKRDIGLYQRELSDITSMDDTLKAKESELISALHSAEASIEEKKRVCTDMEKKLGEVRTRLHALEKEVTEGEGRIALLRRDCENLRERLHILSVQDEELTAKRERALSSLERIGDEMSEMEARALDLRKLLEEKERDLSAQSDEIRELEHHLDSERKNLFNRAEQLSSIRNEIKHLSMMIEDIDRKAGKRQEEMDSVRDEIHSLKEAITRMKEEYTRAESELISMKRTRDDRTSQLNQKRISLKENEEFLYQSREELAAMNSKLESLRELYASQKSTFDESIKALCQVADIFETPPEYETAIESILGDKLNAAIVENREELTKALEIIKEKDKKRRALISIEQAGKSVSVDFNPATDGIIGRAVEFVRITDGFERIASALLGDVILVDSLSTAFSLWEGSSNSSRPLYFVTLDGDVVEPSGLVCGGRERGVLKIKRMLKELEGSIATKKEQILNGERTIDSLKNEIAAMEDGIASLEGDIVSKERYCHEMEVKISSTEEEAARQTRKLEYLSIEMKEGETEKGNFKDVIAEKMRMCDSLEAEKGRAEGNIRDIQEKIADRKRSLEILRSGLTEIKLDLTAISEKIASVTRERERLNSIISEIDTKKAEMSQERLEIEENIQNKEEEVRKREGDLKSRVVLIGELQAEDSMMKERLETETAELERLEERHMSIVSELEKVRKELSQIEVKKTELAMKLNYLKEDIRKTYFIDIEHADIPEAVTQEEEEALPRLKEKLQEIGPVSLGTLEEFEELKGRYEFLTRQQNDLLQSIESLQETISKINRSTQRRLKEAFEALNEKFKEVFTILFGNGRAELILTENDILEAGIDIVAQPPGKRLKNLLSLSGGEQALTALSLLFAGFLVKPTPLCILDEVDAPLDESNTERFTGMLTELSKNIQFITITHNRRTMEAADYIYGITMEEPGVSKVISMHLAEAV